jgi:hypothetical protein
MVHLVGYMVHINVVSALSGTTGDITRVPNVGGLRPTSEHDQNYVPITASTDFQNGLYIHK